MLTSFLPTATATKYLGVPRSKSLRMMNAESIGAFVSREIKPKHRFKKIV